MPVLWEDGEVGMINTDKVLIGLGQHISGRTPERCECCPYFIVGSGYGVSCRDELLDDLYEMLEAQEPRVMTLEELISNISSSAWMETWNNALYEGWALIYDRQTNGISIMARIGITHPNGHVSWLKEMGYGKTWRCWTSRPSDEQREATPWN